LDYLPGGEELVEITSLRHHRARHEGVIVHESRFLEERDIKYVDNIGGGGTGTPCDFSSFGSCVVVLTK